jgi:hypothetical protein
MSVGWVMVVLDRIIASPTFFGKLPMLRGDIVIGGILEASPTHPAQKM